MVTSFALRSAAGRASPHPTPHDLPSYSTTPQAPVVSHRQAASRSCGRSLTNRRVPDHATTRRQPAGVRRALVGGAGPTSSGQRTRPTRRMALPSFARRRARASPSRASGGFATGSFRNDGPPALPDRRVAWRGTRPARRRRPTVYGSVGRWRGLRSVKRVNRRRFCHRKPCGRSVIGETAARSCRIESCPALRRSAPFLDVCSAASGWCGVVLRGKCCGRRLA